MKRWSRVLPARRPPGKSPLLRSIAFALASAAMLAGAPAPAAAADAAAADPAARYPDMRAQWTRLGSAQWDPGKPGGRGQQIPFTAEYAAIFDHILADREKGGLENNATASCIPSGMPRTMIVYETMETIVTPDATCIRGSYMNELRRIYTDGRDWPAAIRPSFMGYSIGRWIDQDGDGVYDLLEVETRGPFKGPRAYDASGLPLHFDNMSVFFERISVDKQDRNVLHDEMTVVDHALTRPWTVDKRYVHEQNEHQDWFEFYCSEGNNQLAIGKEHYFISGDGMLMPTRRGQPGPDLRYFSPAKK
jgi:hypothetical protein